MRGDRDMDSDIEKEFIRVFLSEIVDLEGEAVNKKYD